MESEERRLPEDVEQSIYRRLDRSSYKWLALSLMMAVFFIFVGINVLSALVFGTFLYYGTRPIFRRLRERGISESTSAAVTLVAVGLPVLIVTVLVLLNALSQAFSLASSGALSDFAPFLREIGVYAKLQGLQFDSVSGFLTSEGFRRLVVGSWGAFSSVTNTMVGFLFSLLLSFTFAFFMFGWGPQARQEIMRLCGDKDVVDTFFTSLDKDLSTVFFGNMLNAVATGIVGAVIYSVINVFAPSGVSVPVPVLLGFLTGIAGLIPLVGSKIVYVPLTGLLLFESARLSEPAGYGFALIFFLVAGIIVDTLPDLFLRPLISGKSTSKGALFVSYLVGPIVFGPVGIFLMPIVTVIFLNFRESILPGFWTETG
jgi:predicted PurR-regulated permease PerM